MAVETVEVTMSCFLHVKAVKIWSNLRDKELKLMLGA